MMEKTTLGNGINEPLLDSVFAPGYLILAENSEAVHDGIAEQAWLCFTEFSPDYITEQ